MRQSDDPEGAKDDDGWLFNTDAVRDVAGSAMQSGLLTPLGPYKVPRKLALTRNMNELRLLHYLCWLGQNSDDGSVAVDSRRVLLFTGLGHRTATTLKQLRSAFVQLSEEGALVPVIETTDLLRKGDRTDYRFTLPWLAAAAPPDFVTVPGGFLWFRWLALLPAQKIVMRVLGLLIAAESNSVPLARIRGECAPYHREDHLIAAPGQAHWRGQPLGGDDRNGAVRLLEAIGIVSRACSVSSREQLAVLNVDVLNCAPRRSSLLAGPHATWLQRARYRSARSVLDIGNPQALDFGDAGARR